MIGSRAAKQQCISANWQLVPHGNQPNHTITAAIWDAGFRSVLI